MAHKSISLDILDDYDVVDNDFCSWEILDPYHDSDSDDFSFPDAADDVTSAEIQVISQYLEASPVSLSSSSEDDDDVSVDDAIMPPPVVVTDDLSYVPFLPLPAPVSVDPDDVMTESDLKNFGIGVVMYDDSEGKYGYEEQVEEEEDYEPGNNDDLYLYDDELIPIGMSNKLEKQRIRKSGKKGGSGKKKNSKKMPHHSNRPGCVFGKHGLGVQHLMI